MKTLHIKPFDYANAYRGVESKVEGDPNRYNETTGSFVDDLMRTLRKHREQGVIIKPVELNLEIE
jgi:hypothetical protein